MSTSYFPPKTRMQMPLDDHMPEYARNGGVLQSGYRLQHYRYGGNPEAEYLRRFQDQVASASDSEFQQMVDSAREMVSTPPLRRMRRHQRKMAQRMAEVGFPYCPDTAELLATGDREYVIDRMNIARQEQQAARERFDPRGRRRERGLELRDRQCTEEERREREGRGRCTMM